MPDFRLTWYPAQLPSASPLVMENEPGAALHLITLSGIDAVPLTPFATSGAGQEGQTALDVTVPPRTITAQVMLDASDTPGLWALRQTIARAFVGSPVRYGESISLGRLLFEYDAKAREIHALPRSSRTDKASGKGRGWLDAEWFCPYPWFSDTTDSEDTIAPAATEVLVNSGDVDAPFVVRFHGPFTSITLTNDTTGESFQINLIVADGEYVEVNTEPTAPAIRYVETDPPGTDAFNALVLANSRLFRLHPGNNSLTFSASDGDGGTHAAISWRNRYAALA